MPPLEQLLAARLITLTRFGGHTLVLDGRGAIYWPVRRLLVVSDLHIGKGSYLRQFANPVPGYDSKDTLLKVNELIDQYQPIELICLGDSFHDTRAYSRLSEAEQVELSTTVARVDSWHWILGNHDPELPVELDGDHANALEVDGLVFSHDLMSTAKHLIIGHFHPKVTLNLEGRKRTGRCFVATEKVMVMPAFGSYTGGLSCHDEAFLPVLGTSGRRYFFIQRNKIWQVAG